MLVEQRLQPLAEVAVVARGDRVARAGERAREALLGDGLEQIVDGVHLERLHRELIVRGHEDDEGKLPLGFLHGVEHLEAVDFRHLHVEDHDVRARLANRGDGARAAQRFAHDLDVRVLREERAKPGERRRLVVDRHDAKSGRHAEGACTGVRRSGSETITSAPPFAPLWSESVPASP